MHLHLEYFITAYIGLEKENNSYYLTGGTSAMGTQSIWSHIGKFAINEAINTFVQPIPIPVNNHLTIGFSPAFGFGDGGLSFGFNAFASYSNGHNSFTLGGSWTNFYNAYSFGASFRNWGFSIATTKYKGGDFYGETIKPQRVGTIGLNVSQVGLSFSNDYFGLIGDRKDRWRTFAAELSVGRYSFGVMAGTNDGAKDSEKITPIGKKPFITETKSNGKEKRFPSWRDGRVYIAPAWIGVKSGNNITRIGFSYRQFQNNTQNVLHYLMKGGAKYYTGYNNIYEGFYSYRGYNNPFSLWNR